MLVENGYEALVIHGGQDALNILTAEKIDLILLDIMMPGMDGREVGKIIREATEWNNIPIVYVTVLDLSKEEQKALKWNGISDHYLKKPFESDELLALIKRVFGD